MATATTDGPPAGPPPPVPVPAPDARPLRPARMYTGDVVRVGATGLRTRPLRAWLSALGIAIGIAAMIAVVGISSSSRAELDRQLAALGTNLLRVEPGTSMISGEEGVLPYEATAMVARIDPVYAVAATGNVPDANVYRSDHIPEGRSGGMTVRAAELDLYDTVGAELADGAWLNAATARYPAAVLGAESAKQLGISSVGSGVEVYLAGQWFTVVGILEPVALAGELDLSVLVGWESAAAYLGFDGHPTTVYARAEERYVEEVAGVLATTANPEAPDEVTVSRPSDALAAKNAVDTAFTGMLLGLGGVALLVGGVGVANTMVISVLERRSEIGLRRSLGATKGQIRTQFLAESLLLSALGGVGGVLLGTAVTAGFAAVREWPTVVPYWASVGGVAATLFIGAVAGLYPAVRASRLSPTEALSAQ
ncbi:putative ABC transport system permease protein [Glycomyces sambucus]|uniref:Putative ABC transport system permease protein n=2 Tax=Glycomyces sambucus TaxID=380244 RepID=A0A1G9JBU7_9ACTN|nr:ABC transporter permease [Glycomyces sambucus]SDL34685.1 putative ABC transport system permease protein [Glycomyces sambucus]